MQSRKLTSLLLVAVLVTLSAVASAAPFNRSNYTPGQNKDTLSGRYEGVAKSDQIGDIPLTVEIKNDNGKITGKIETPQGPAAITGGTYENGKLTMKFDAGGNEGTVTATIDGDKITGKWELGGQGGGLELKRSTMAAGGASAAPKPATPPAATPPVATPPAATGGDPISGEWDATADAGGTSLPFTLKLKLEGDKVTGSSDSSQGSAPLSKGSFSANKLSFSLDTPNGAISMTALLKDGKLVGDFDFAGQMTGKWEASKKK
jgi:hypothetical protein